ncbi:hypothetical protein AKJ64_01835 [candidate division MSBL1 archaeon SCGC-AAA259E17]|uniref:Uncharacterized protein n=1 Tax=candidate division MSBL1 archaeon SCGC-AAA259E17 TaxID=1698263 RepID=A0A133UFF9_9EURY|nr:hypothetical protein AKJ64_01835 [candidate division MSBL1 archaeon SCGC-AAA259E17]
MDASARPQVSLDAEIRERMRSTAGDLLTEELVPEGLQGKVEVVVNADGTLSISRRYLEDSEFEEYLEWVRSAPEISESVRWDDTIHPGEYRLPKETLTKMVRSAEPYRKMHQLPKSKVLGHAVEIYYRMRGESHSEELCSFIGWALARTNHPDLEEICRRLEENIREAVGQALGSYPNRSDVVEITLDGTWLRVLNLIRTYGIPKVTFKGDGDKLTLEGVEESRGVLVKAELEGPGAGSFGLEKLEVSAETLAEALRAFDLPCRAEVWAEDREMRVRSLDPGRAEPDSVMKWTLPVKKTPREEPENLDMDYPVEAESMDLEFSLYAAEEIHGREGFQATISVEDGKLLLYYWTEGSPEGHKSLLGKARGDGVSFTYRPELLEPLKGEWDLKLGEGLPLRAEKTLDGGEVPWKADVAVVLPPGSEKRRNTALGVVAPLFLEVGVSLFPISPLEKESSGGDVYGKQRRKSKRVRK